LKNIVKKKYKFEKEESWENNTEFEKIILKENQHGCV